ncbi:bacillithiol system redox-active protein YtxJ [Paenibacillus sp. 1P07SE]|uniref:bacillithiol system redox-active protein YtxJ n=1 Tax=Paenibacillus sp. 1P07SE TaxID=3132209 RepID=UPI0039A519A7
MASYKEIDTLEQWKQLLDASHDHQVVIFKHSTTCPVSANALSEFEHYLDAHPDNATTYALVKVIESRPVSNQIAEDTGVKHESPQIILLQGGKKYWTASHWSITQEHMKAVMQ